MRAAAPAAGIDRVTAAHGRGDAAHKRRRHAIGQGATHVFTAQHVPKNAIALDDRRLVGERFGIVDETCVVARRKGIRETGGTVRRSQIVLEGGGQRRHQRR